MHFCVSRESSRILIVTSDYNYVDMITVMRKTSFAFVARFVVLLVVVCDFGSAKAQRYGYVEPLKQADVYAGIPVPLNIITDGKPEDISLTVSVGIVKDSYLTVPDSMVGKKVKISVMKKSSKTETEIGSSTFWVYKVPDPQLVIGSHVRGGYQNRGDLLFYPKIRATMEVNFPYDIKWEVINFRAIVIRDGKVVADEVCRGDMLTENLQALIRDLPGHSTVVFDNVVVTSVVGTRVLKGFTVIIRDEETAETVYDEDNLVDFAEQMPEFPGGQDALNAYLAKEVNYPEVAKAHGVSGTVVVEFVVEKDGSISNVKVITPLFPPCDEEVLRVISSMPKWIPARNKGVPVRSFLQIPVTFRMR